MLRCPGSVARSIMAAGVLAGRPWAMSWAQMMGRVPTPM